MEENILSAGSAEFDAASAVGAAGSDFSTASLNPAEDGVREFTAAVLDLGSNSLRMTILNICRGGAIRRICEKSRAVRLGEGAFESGMLQPEAMERTLDALRSFADACRLRGVSEYSACATAAMRDAANGAEFAERIFRETGIRFRILSGVEEARYVCLGMSSCLPAIAGCRMFIDIGGGSAEIGIMRGSKMLWGRSLALGAVRLSEMFKDFGIGPVGRDAYNSLKKYAAGAVGETAGTALAFAPAELIGSSGTVKCCANVAAARREGTAADGGAMQAVTDSEVLTLDELRETADILCAVGLEERRLIPGMNAKRADIIIPGTAVLETVMELAGIESIRYCDRGLRAGLIEELRNKPGSRNNASMPF